MKLNETFYIIVWKDEICYADYPHLCFFPYEKLAEEQCERMQPLFPDEEYNIKKIKIEIVD